MIDRFIDWCILRRKRVIGILLLLTTVMGFFAARVEVKTVFSDLLPQNHPFVGVNNHFKQVYGGSNMVSVMVEVGKGDILNRDVLSKIQKINNELAKVTGADPFQITSIASKKLKEIKSSTDGIKTRPLMWPDLPKNDEEIAQLRKSITNNPLVYGAYVSQDFKAALITVDFYDHLVDYKTIFNQVARIMDGNRGEGLTLHAVGEPILYGWVLHYLTETATIFLATIACLVALLFLIARTWHGTAIPLVAAVLSAVWAIGFSGMMNYNLDPMVVVVAFLITALAVSNSVQIVSNFDQKIRSGIETTAEGAAKAALRTLFRPAMLAVVADAGCVLVVVLTPIPLLQKIAIIGCVWVLSIAIFGVVVPALLAASIRNPKRYAHPVNITPVLNGVLALCAKVTTSRGRYLVIAGAVLLFIASGMYAFNLKVGDANPGSPILRANSAYNKDAALINNVFQGSDRMFVVASGEKPDTVKQPQVLENIEKFQRFMDAQPEIGGSVSLADVLPTVNQVLHEGNPHYLVPGSDANVNGELAYLFVSGSDPGDIQRFASSDYKNASVTLFFRDHQGDTIRNAIARINEFVEKNQVPGVTYLLAGGLVGVLAAVNEVILAGQIEAIALALLVLVIVVAITYRSLVAGMFFMIPVLLANTLTFSYMAYMGIGMNINTLPVVALGIGLGVDYSIYVVDAIREEMHAEADLKQAIINALNSAGLGVLITVMTLVLGVILWSFSSLRLQAEMGALIAIWLMISAAASLILMPALVYVFKPAFVMRSAAPKGAHATRGVADADKKIATA
ncbi:MAG: efflux transporter, family [Massilia sp.]|jgi:predicted RND superfamily exporter protein|nr:efflux transporter, family [Massilia sp.]MDB5953029.1 efflux transporter, family [Massilia sp.]